MPMFVAALLGGLISVCGTLAGRVLVALGISAVTYSGLSVSLDWLRDSAFAALDVLPANILGVFGVLKVGVMISIISSAYTVRLVLGGLTSGTVTKWIGK